MQKEMVDAFTPSVNTSVTVPRINVRHADDEDVGHIYKVQCECYASDYWEPTSLFHRIVEKRTSYVAVDEDDTIIGYILCHSLLDLNNPPRLGQSSDIHNEPSDVWYIHDLVVLTSYRKQGIADQLITALEHYARKNQIQHVSCMALPRAIPFWNRRGYMPYHSSICKVVHKSYGFDAMYAYKTLR